MLPILPPGTTLASFWHRVGAQLIDSVLSYLLSVALSLLAAMLGLMAGGPEITVEGLEEPSLAATLMLQLILALVVLLFWATRQATPGKLLLGLRIVDAGHGGMPGFGQLVRRYVGYIVSAIPFCLGYFWVLWDGKRQGWHDKMAHTLVVRVPRGS